MQKTPPSSHLEPNQTIQSNNNEVIPKCTLTFSKNMYIKDCIIAWSTILEFLKAFRFLYLSSSFSFLQKLHAN